MAGILRREQFQSAPAFSFQDLDQQARAVLRRAEAQGREILAEAERRGAQIGEQRRQEGHQRGLEEGRRAGLEQVQRETRETALREARQRLRQLTDALAKALGECERDKRRLLAAAESGLIELALAVARRVCKIAAGASSEPALANARALLELARHGADAELRFHPEEFAEIQATAAEFLRDVGQLRHVKLAADANVARGGCVLATNDGTADAALETQLDRIAAALLPDVRKEVR